MDKKTRLIVRCILISSLVIGIVIIISAWNVISWVSEWLSFGWSIFVILRGGRRVSLLAGQLLVVSITARTPGSNSALRSRTPDGERCLLQASATATEEVSLSCMDFVFNFKAASWFSSLVGETGAKWLRGKMRKLIFCFTE